MKAPLSLLITGASSGIGAALALEYAAPAVRLFLGGRDRIRLEAVAAACRAKGALAETAVVDVTDAMAMADWITAADGAKPLELVIANAGISGGTAHDHETSDQTRRIFAVNVTGVLNTVLPVIPLLRARGRGQIALMSSMAGFRGFPGSPAYCESKAAVKVWGESLRVWLATDGVEVSVICPGYIITPMPAVNRFFMPFLMPAPPAARIIRRGLAQNRSRIAFPWPMAAVVNLLAALPPGLVDPLLRLMPAKD
ncbi:MAG: SDR family NAD(P)-dependent oxidoreductase [Alphaproteobacteria bacterium]|nr:SDR family NAD(P)-dependent oxidoreductase [Alphaproteobacteria bacterium]